MPSVIEKQPYAIYPCPFDRFTAPPYKRMVGFAPMKWTNRVQLQQSVHNKNGRACSAVHNRPVVINIDLQSDHPSTTNSDSSRWHFKSFKRPQSCLSTSCGRNLSGKRKDVNCSWFITSKILLNPRLRKPPKQSIPMPDFEFEPKSYLCRQPSAKNRTVKKSRYVDPRPHSAPQSNLTKTSQSITSTGRVENSTICQMKDSKLLTRLENCRVDSSDEDITFKRPLSAPPNYEEFVHSDNFYLANPFISQSNHSTGYSKMHQKENIIQRQTLTNVRIESDYDIAVKKYGWRMEIPGDPLNLKKPFLPKRFSYSVNCELSPTLPEAPLMVKENVDTFFLKTTKVQPLSFTINPDFSSERYNARKNELLKRGLWPYTSRKFGFSY